MKKEQLEAFIYPLLAIFLGLYVADSFLYDLIFKDTTSTTSE